MWDLRPVSHAPSSAHKRFVAGVFRRGWRPSAKMCASWRARCCKTYNWRTKKRRKNCVPTGTWTKTPAFAESRPPTQPKEREPRHCRVRLDAAAPPTGSDRRNATKRGSNRSVSCSKTKIYDASGPGCRCHAGLLSVGGVFGSNWCPSAKMHDLLPVFRSFPINGMTSVPPGLDCCSWQSFTSLPACESVRRGLSARRV